MNFITNYRPTEMIRRMRRIFPQSFTLQEFPVTEQNAFGIIPLFGGISY